MTPKLGLGWRHRHYGHVLEALPELHFLEVHSENFFGGGGAAIAVLEQARSHYPVSLHGVSLSLGSACGLDPAHLDQLEALVRRVEPMRVSDHACFARGRVPQIGRIAHGMDLLPLPFSQEALAVICANVDAVQERLKRPIAVENLSAYVRWLPEEMSEPQFLNAVAQRTGCGLLVDLNNIHVNAMNACVDPAERGSPAVLKDCMDWLNAIAKERVVELHLAGAAVGDGLVVDDHSQAVAQPVWALYNHALERFGAVDTVIEWDTDVPDWGVLYAERERARHIAQAVKVVAP